MDLYFMSYFLQWKKLACWYIIQHLGEGSFEKVYNLNGGDF